MTSASRRTLSLACSVASLAFPLVVALPAGAQPPLAPTLAPAPAAAPAPVEAASATAPTELAARADGLALSVCGTEPIAALAARVVPSMVEVEGSLFFAHGFSFGDPDLVLVPAAVAESGRGVLVRHEGSTWPAIIAAIDEDAGLALLRVPGLQLTPLAASAIRPEQGVAATAFARPWGAGDDEPLQAMPGTVSSSLGRRFRVTGRVGYGRSVGAPVVDCFGAVVGASTLMGDQAVSMEPAVALLRRTRAGAEPYEGGLRVRPSMRMLGEFDARPWVGLELGASLIERDRWELSLLGRTLATGEDGTSDDAGWTTRRWGARGGGELRAGARLMLRGGGFALYVVPQVGVGVDVKALGGTADRAQIEGDGCSPEAPCPVVGSHRDLPTRVDLGVGPTLGLAFRVGPFDVGYTFRIDATDLDDSSHQVGLGFAF